MSTYRAVSRIKKKATGSKGKAKRERDRNVCNVEGEGGIFSVKTRLGKEGGEKREWGRANQN